jgi:hypothetical protein
MPLLAGCSNTPLIDFGFLLEPISMRRGPSFSVNNYDTEGG